MIVMSLILSQDTSVDSPQNVTFDDAIGAKVFGLLKGTEGRKHVLSVTNNLVNPIVRVQPTWHKSINPPEYVHSAVIENLIIDGKGHNNTGILLENVCNCQIRNITIRDCEVGIHIRNKWGLWSETNCLKHIRMENVKTGILFTTAGPYEKPGVVPGSEEDVKVKQEYPGASMGFTVIDDVDIKLADNSSDVVGIQVGGKRIITDPDGIHDTENTLISPYSSRIRANVWLGSGGGAGLKMLNGRLYYGQAHLTVHNAHNSANGIGIDLQNVSALVDNNRPIWQNQFSEFSGNHPNDSVVEEGFMLVTSGISDPTKVIRKPTHIKTDVKTKTF